MFSQAALQPCSNQPYWDLLIPIYLGKPDDEFDPAKLTALLIQVKNSQKNKYDVLKNHYELLFGLDNPIITIMLDLGINKPAIHRVESFASNVFAFTATGAGDDTYNCISGGMEESLSKILSHPTNASGNYRRDISVVNRRFREHSCMGRAVPSLVFPCRRWNNSGLLSRGYNCRGGTAKRSSTKKNRGVGMRRPRHGVCHRERRSGIVRMIEVWLCHSPTLMLNLSVTCPGFIVVGFVAFCLLCLDLWVVFVVVGFVTGFRACISFVV